MENQRRKLIMLNLMLVAKKNLPEKSMNFYYFVVNGNFGKLKIENKNQFKTFKINIPQS